ncbi:MAG: rhomboid family intramembrane serine protease [Salinisphaera sp.]|nr:rhomboid family intramembrane serine protease [Salinisphaera sp.]
MVTYLALWPLGDHLVQTPRGTMSLPSFHFWQLISYGFLHGGITHILFNMFGLWMFGRVVEQVWGQWRFLIYYLVCVAGAGVCQLLVQVLTGQPYPTIGASGGVFGVLLAFGMMFPNARVMLLIPPIPMTAKWLVIGYGALELFFGVTGVAPGVAHFAHLGGMAFGFALILYWRHQDKQRRF